MSIPAKLDVGAMLHDLRSAGWLDQKLEIACSLSNGYIAQLRAGRINRISYEFGARLYNLWLDECGDVCALTLEETTT